MKFRFSKIFIFILLFCFGFSASLFAQQNESAKPWVFWYWVKGAVSKAGITADLEAMKSNGIAGAYLMSIQGPDKVPVYSPPAVQLTPEWWQMVEFAMSEAKRLDLKIGMHVSDGFALAGGPWITPEFSMQKVVWSKINISNTVTKINLPQPESKENYYKDIAVYAYPSPIGESISTRTVAPKITASNGADATGLVQPGNKKNFGSNEPCYIQYEFVKPFTCRTISIKISGNNYQAQRLAIEVSDDRKNFRSIGRLGVPRHGWQDTDEDVTHSIVPTTAKFFRFIYDKKGSEPGSEDLDAAKWKPSLKLVNLELSSEAQLNQFEGKNGSVWRISKRSTEAKIAKNLCVPLNKIINLTDKLNPDGTLNWKAPKGNWTILRIGHTSTGHTNATGGGGKGLECDKFNPEAVKLQFKNWYGEALKHGGPEIAKKVLSVFHVDSWECGSQNWSPVFKAEFLKRRGYDLTPYLPIMTGLPVENVSVSENFLYDVRKTISELVVDQFYKPLAKLAKDQGVTFTAESIAPTMMSDGLMHYKTVDVPMGEFWLNSPTHDKPNDMLDAISGAHIYGKNIIQAEAFTTVRMDWNESPANMKTLQDRNYALGINKLVYHVFTHNPWTDRKPGMTLDGVGLYFQRDQTWWKAGKAWIDYAERTQNLLQQGKPVVDIAVFTGEELPRRSVLPDRLVETLPGIFGADVVEAEKKRLANVGEPLRQMPAGVTHSANMADPENWVNPLRGYAYDSFNPDVLSTATVKDGNVVFESGATYKILVFTGKLKMNPNYQYISYQTIKKLLELIKAGAKVTVADKPLYQNGLKQVRKIEFDRMVNEIWDKNVTPNFIKKIGLGVVVKAPYYGENFHQIRIETDFFALEDGPINKPFMYAKNVAYTHRKTDEKDIYFISNQEAKERKFRFSFRVKDKVPLVYNAVNNETTNIKRWSAFNGRTVFNLKLEPNQSVFILFRKSTKEKNFNKGNNWSNFRTIQDISKTWQAKFDTAYAGPSKPIIFNDLTDWTRHTDSLVKYYSGTATYSKNFTFNEDFKGKIWLDLGEFSSIAEVKINGINCGTLWTAPHRLEISKAIKKGENQITIGVTNTWANRLIGDSKLPENKRITKTTAPFRLEGKALNPAGLLGPVVIQVEE
ncbi:DNA-binding protein [Pedobacter sp. ISL-68]|uniref:glycosyl hydrolase n=1 Tax=unclassified Pedobacter TaxID=2628915 RepID=UPI001BEA221E|nr:MULTISPECIES: glycosyl hydrolase [unclassified Pedobacter]MBT2561231.1 DNA-binding protein [Pedobacter sp. ISL-64]MBT2590620.1 DNA-binding protein [Pedobacter sp. ISL-68]